MTRCEKTVLSTNHTESLDSHVKMSFGSNFQLHATVNLGHNLELSLKDSIRKLLKEHIGNLDKRGPAKIS